MCKASVERKCREGLNHLYKHPFYYYIYRLVVLIEDKRWNILKVLGGKMNKEGPDLFGRYGHCERVISRSSSAVV